MYSKQAIEKLSFAEAVILAGILKEGKLVDDEVDCKEAAIYKNLVEIRSLKCYDNESGEISAFTFIFKPCGLEEVIKNKVFLSKTAYKNVWVY
jgi:hypothetical protein